MGLGGGRVSAMGVLMTTSSERDGESGVGLWVMKWDGIMDNVIHVDID